MVKRSLAVFLFTALLGTGLYPQRPPADTSGQSIFRTTTREVVLDVVVRDKHHRPVTDLRPEEVQVFEDGVRQKVHSFRDVRGAEQLQTELTISKDANGNGNRFSAEPTHTTTLKQINFVSVVLAHIAPLNLEFAREAVVDFLQSETLPNTYVTVYRLDRRLDLIQPYTSDKPSLTKAINIVTKGIHAGGDLGLQPRVAGGANALIQSNVTNILADPSIGAATAQAVLNVAQNPLPGIAKDPLWARDAASQDVSVTLGNALLTQAHIANGLRFAESLSNGMDFTMPSGI